jgi:hypothetical protein
MPVAKAIQLFWLPHFICDPVPRCQVKLSLDYKGLRPGMAAQHRMVPEIGPKGTLT